MVIIPCLDLEKYIGVAICVKYNLLHLVYFGCHNKYHRLGDLNT